MNAFMSWRKTSAMLCTLSILIGLTSVSAQAPTVSLTSNTTVVGSRNAYGLEQFLGIPYAQPPLGELRFAKPLPIHNHSSTSVDATAYGPVCMQAPTNFNVSQMSEDCLSINIVRPGGVNMTSKLPVMVWVYGGGFVTGGSSGSNPTAIILRSAELGSPVIHVSFNYRVNSFGFLASSDVAAAASNGTAALNVGLYDIQAALLWVQQNIGSFGGDQTKVTVFGQSAGAMSIGSMLVADWGKAVKELGLFRGAIMESGAPSGYFHDTQPSKQVRAGRVSTIPVMMGNNLDEGTEFAPIDVANSSVIIPSIEDHVYLNNASASAMNGTILTKLLELYPDNPALGSPFAPPIVPPSYRFYEPLSTNQYKRLAAMFGDSIFHAGRRLLLDAYLKKDKFYPVYNYLFVQNIPGMDPALGVYHSAEIQFGELFILAFGVPPL
ncbi:alpha/beta-hydrolase [Clavulina sp. PMI_390]|nr:alpha/beta-hydrolase [Clavulina sp. PMI_390]